MIQMNLLTKQKQTHRFREQTWLPGEGQAEATVREFGMDVSTFSMFKTDNQPGVTVYIAHGTLCYVLCGSLDGRGFGGAWIQVYAGLSPFTIHLKYNIINWLYSNAN